MLKLPWQSINDIGSNSLVTFTIKQLPNLAWCLKINATASIYFNFNEPIITNTALNTIGDGTIGINESKNQNSKFKIYPNPVSDILYIKTANTDVNSINIYDLTGRLLFTQKINPGIANTIIKTDVKALANGIYFIEIQNFSGETTTAKFAKN